MHHPHTAMYVHYSILLCTLQHTAMYVHYSILLCMYTTAYCYVCTLQHTAMYVHYSILLCMYTTAYCYVCTLQHTAMCTVQFTYYIRTVNNNAFYFSVLQNYFNQN